MDRIKARLNVGDYVVPRDVHDASGVFKFILRSLPQPLVPTELYEAAIDEPETSHAVFAQIPEPNRTIAGFVVRFIHDYFLAPEIVDVTLMTPDNLATVLFPCLIRNPSSDLMEIMRHVEQEKTWMRKCFTSLDVSSFPTLDQCRELAGLTHGPAAAAPAPSPTAADSSAPATPDEQTSTLMQAADPPTPSEAEPEAEEAVGADNASAAAAPAVPPQAVSPLPSLPHPTNPPPMPPMALPRSRRRPRPPRRRRRCRSASRHRAVRHRAARPRSCSTSRRSASTATAASRPRPPRCRRAARRPRARRFPQPSTSRRPRRPRRRSQPALRSAAHPARPSSREERRGGGHAGTTPCRPTAHFKNRHRRHLRQRARARQQHTTFPYPQHPSNFPPARTSPTTCCTHRGRQHKQEQHILQCF